MGFIIPEFLITHQIQGSEKFSEIVSQMVTKNCEDPCVNI